MTTEVDKIMKMDNGKLAVKWKGSKKFRIIEDNDIALYLVYLMTRSKEEVMENVNSMCR